MKLTDRPSFIGASSVGVLVASTATAQPVAPAFSVGRSGPSGLDTRFLYNNTDLPGTPTAFAAGPASGLLSGDAINGFSQRQMITEFLLCFSVDERSDGAAGLLPVDHPLFPPHNVVDQSDKGQQSGSAFLSTEAFNRAGILSGPVSMGEFNNVLAINQAPQYVADFGLLPNIGPDLDAGGAPMDDVEGGGGAGALGAGGPLYFTLDQASATAASNVVIVDPSPLLVGGVSGDEGTFADAHDLGLSGGDDIDALAVFDVDADSVFSGSDQILFSLTPGSSLLTSMGWSAADVLTVSFGDAMPSLFADAATLGLSDDDNLNMLELVPLQGTAEQTIIAKVPGPASTAAIGCLGLMGCVARRRRNARI